ncbi:MAG: alginate lyase family protein [Opitutales bacterium]|nr:alginate lyase family protein [Opitutales bacterium]
MILKIEQRENLQGLWRLALFLFVVTTSLGADPHEAFVRAHAEELHRLFNQLNTESDPHLAEAVALWKQRKKNPALQLLYHSIINGPKPSGLIEAPDLPSGSLDRARDALQDRYHIQGQVGVQPRLENGGLDWNYHGPANDKEWAWMLNRHLSFIDLIEAWEATGEGTYLDQLFKLWNDWLDSQPYPARHTFSAAWRPLEVSRRILDSWPQVYFRLPDDDPRSLQLRVRILASLLEHGDALDRFASFWGGNHLITEKTALVKLALVWPELKPSEGWLNKGVEELKQALENQTYPDGAHKELTYHYQRVTVLHAQRLLALLKAAGKQSQAAEFSPLVESMWNYFILVMRPDGSGPLNNASDLEWTGLHTEGIPEFFGRPDWQYILSRGAEGQRPKQPYSHFFPWAGHLVMRSGWDPQADWAFFHLGPRGTAHDHDDHLHLSVFANGRSLLTDSGRYTYLPGPWRDYFKGPRAHNLILVDGEGPLPQPHSVRRAMKAKVDIQDDTVFAKGSNRFPAQVATGRGGARHERSVHYHSAGFWIVKDHLIASGSRKAEILWHFHPDVSTEESSQILQLVHGPANTTRSDATGQEQPQIAGFYSPQYNERIPRIQSTWTQRGSGPATWIWLIQSPDEAAVVSKVHYDSERDRIEVELKDGSSVTW